jgi:hypothetical protein
MIIGDFPSEFRLTRELRIPRLEGRRRADAKADVNRRRKNSGMRFRGE